MLNKSLALNQSAEDLRNAFLNLKTPSEVAALLDIDHGRLIYHLYILPDEAKYTTFLIPKKGGGHRTICAPISALKILQRKLSQVLVSIYRARPSVHGFVNERSIVTNAQPHLKRRYVFNIDLLNFFPSINFGRVRGLFMGRPYILPDEVATVLAQICCFRNELPQGAPTSPIIANMICGRLDSDLQHLAKAHKTYYTRYADDLTFSTNLSAFPSALATVNTLNQVEVGGQLKNVIEKNGFSINPKKVRLQKRSQTRQEVTGITVNESLNVSRKYVRQVKAMLHAWKKYGLLAAETEYLAKYERRHRHSTKTKLQFRHVVKGKIEYIGMVKGKEDPVFLKLYKLLGLLDKELAPPLAQSLKTPSPTEFLDRFLPSFNSQEIDLLCFKLGIDKDEIPDGPKSIKASELYSYVARRGAYG